jgi:hypothetical protein
LTVDPTIPTAINGPGSLVCIEFRYKSGVLLAAFGGPMIPEIAVLAGSTGLTAVRRQVS